MSFTHPPIAKASRPRWDAADEGRFPALVPAPGDSGRLFPNSAPWEAQLVRRVARGDHEAFGTLHDHYAKPLYSFTVGIINDPWEAQDVLQEAFLKIWEKAPLFDETEGRPFSWAATVARNTAIDRLRARQRERRVFDEDNADSVEVDETLDLTHPVEHIRRDQAAHIRAAVSELPDHQRRPIELAFFEELTHLEIAEVLAEPLGTIKARIRRGILRLRDELAGRI